ncbi:MAG: ABC transporter permease, partial [Chloroflexi bacterium]|nr:ABC transporter permease [Chloroflexota bacterium]
SPSERAAAAKELGLDQPLPLQYGLWLSRVVQGDFGKSLVRRRPVLEELSGALKNTLILALSAGAIGWTAGITLGALAAFNRGKFLDKLASAVAITGVSMPNFWMAILLIIIFSIHFKVLPPSGMSTVGSDFSVGDLASHLIMPAIALSMVPMGVVTRMVRASVLEILGNEFVLALRAKGLPPRQVLFHVLKNAAPPVMTVMGLQLSNLLGGSVLVEAVFAWPGEGFLINLALAQRDFPVLQAGILVLASFFVISNLVVDILHGVVDPRIVRA